jgi:Flp pilus assembly protein TadG
VKRVTRNDGSRRSRGLAAVEFALLLPVLVVLGLGVVDLARALQAQVILISIAREGASLASRASPYDTPTIITSLAAATPPLDILTNKNGMIYITGVMGSRQPDGSIRNVVVSQYRCVAADCGTYAPASSVWTCGSWSGGTCNVASPPPTANVMTGLLADGELIYSVEAYYRFSMFFAPGDLGRGVRTPQIGPDLRAISVM